MTDLTIRNATLMPCTPAMPVIDGGHVTVAGEVIVSAGPGPGPDAVEILDGGGGIVMSGMVNPHAHLPMTLFRGLGEDVDDRLFRYGLPMERKFVMPEMVRTGTALAAWESIRAGVTTVADMVYFEAEAGVRVAQDARSNAKVGSGIARAAAKRAAGVPVGIATDGPMSGNTLDFFSQFGPVSMFQKFLGHSRKPMPARDVIHMATIEGARVPGLDGLTGSLEPGKDRRRRADLFGRPAPATCLRPIYNPRLRRDARRHARRHGRWPLADAGSGRSYPEPQEGAARRRTGRGVLTRRNDRNRTTGGARMTRLDAARQPWKEKTR